MAWLREAQGGASARVYYTTVTSMARLREAQERRERPRPLYHIFTQNASFL